MGGYIGSNIGTIANAAERKQTYSITTATTSLTGLAYTPTKVHVFHNGVRLVDGTDYTATNGTSITLTNAAQNGDEVVVISYPSFQTSDTVSAANGGTFAGNVAFSGTTTGLDVNGTDLILDADGDSKIEASTDDTITVHTAGSESCRIDSSGRFMLGKTSSGIANVGSELRDGDSDYAVLGTASGTAPFIANRTSSDGEIFQFRKDNSTVGKLRTDGGKFGIEASDANGLNIWVNGTNYYSFDGIRLYPIADNTNDLGIATKRFDDIFATNGTIQTSDRNEKQDIEDLSEAELRVATAAKGLIKKYRWIDAVQEKGDNARIHVGIIAQDLQAAFEAEGLDASRYAMFTSDTWTDEETGEERTRLGVRYPELLAFIIGAL